MSDTKLIVIVIINIGYQKKKKKEKKKNILVLYTNPCLAFDPDEAAQ